MNNSKDQFPKFIQSGMFKQSRSRRNHHQSSNSPYRDDTERVPNYYIRPGPGTYELELGIGKKQKRSQNKTSPSCFIMHPPGSGERKKSRTKREQQHRFYEFEAAKNAPKMMILHPSMRQVHKNSAVANMDYASRGPLFDVKDWYITPC